MKPGRATSGRAGSVPRRGLATLALAGGGAVLLPACSRDSAPDPPGPGVSGELVATRTRMRASAPAVAGAALAPFSAALYRSALSPDENALLSPYSVLAALGMTALGASGPVASAFERTLGSAPREVAAHLTAVDAAVTTAVAASERAAARVGRGAQASVVRPANSLFVQRGYPVRKDFLEAVAEGYAAGVHLADYRKDAEGARAQINAWVAQRTERLIPELVPPGMLDPRTRLTLVNALYLRAQWAEALTKDPAASAFTTLAGTTVSVVRLRTGSLMPYAAGADWEAVGLPYRGGGLAMTFVVPRPGRFRAVVSRLDAATLRAAVAGRPRQVSLAVPGFTARTSSELTEVLSRMGLAPAFGGPFPAIATPRDEPPPTMSAVIHEARIAVDEHGTEAAAATAVVMRALSAPTDPVELVVDRPFVYLVHDTSTGVPLFIGHVVDPTA